MRALPVIEISNEEVYVSITFCSRVDLSGSLNQQTNKKNVLLSLLIKIPITCLITSGRLKCVQVTG